MFNQFFRSSIVVILKSIEIYQSSEMSSQNQGSQVLPDDDFSMVRDPEDILPTPPLPPRGSRGSIDSGIHPVGDEDPDILDISDSRPNPNQEPPEVSGDLLSEAIKRAVSGDPEVLQDAGWDIMEEDHQEEEEAPLPSSVKPRRRVLVMGEDGEFQQESVDDDVFEDEVADPVQSSGASSHYVPPNQLAVDLPPQISSQGPDQVPSFSSSEALSGRPSKRKAEEMPVTLRDATYVVPPPGTLAERISSAVGRVNYFCPVLEVVKNGEPGFLQHDFPLLDVPEYPDPTPKDLGEDRFFSVKELATGKKMRTVPLSDFVEFILIAKDQENNIYVPSTSFFDLVVNRIEINVITKYPNLRPLSWGSSKWMGCGILELAAAPLLEEWRLVLSKMELNNGIVVDTFPKASLLMGPDITALLKDPYREYGIRWVSHSLLYRNKALRGNVRLTHSKCYGEHDLTRFGTSMHEWRMVYLTGDCIFMEFLSKHPPSHRFTVGPSTVALKGGIRKPAFLEKPKTQFTWTRTTFTPALLEPIYSLKPSELDPPVFKGLAAATANLTIKPTPPSSSTPSSSSRKKNVPSSAPQPSTSAPSSSSSNLSRSASVDGGTAGKKSIPPLKKAASASAIKPKSRSARIKAAKNKKCC